MTGFLKLYAPEHYMRYCVSCGSQMEDGTEFCPKCGVRNGESVKFDPVRSDSGDMNPAAIVLGILGILLGLFVPIIGLILGVIGIVLSSKGSVGHRNTGFVLSVLAILVSVVSWIFGVIILMSLYGY